VGPRRGVPETAFLLGVECAPLDRLDGDVRELDGPVLLLRGLDPEVDSLVGTSGEPAEERRLAEELSELRLVKDDHEIRMLERAVEATVRGFEDVVRALPEAMEQGERWWRGSSTFAPGSRATTSATTPLRRAGPTPPSCIGPGTTGRFAAATSSSSMPGRGRRAVHGRRHPDAAGVGPLHPGAAPPLRAGAAGPGGRDRRGQAGSGLPRPPPGRDAGPGRGPGGARHPPDQLEKALAEDVQAHRRYTLHGTSHMLGLDVHDCAQAREEEYRGGRLQPGHVLTVEPGLYLQPDDLTVPEELRGIGIRIEDDVLVTEDGCRVLSRGLPTDPDELERWMAGLRGQEIQLRRPLA